MDTNANNSDILAASADALRQQAQALTPREQLLTHALEELSISLEELRVAEEELRVQNEALEELRDSLELQSQRYQDLFDQAPEAYLVTDAAGRVREANEAAAVLLSVTARGLVGRPLGRFVAPAEQARFREVLQSASDAPAGGFLRLKTQNGEFPVMLTVTSARDKAGRPGALRWLFRDATAVGRAEEERYHLLVQDLVDYGVFLMDATGRVLTWNTGAERIFGYAPAEILGRRAATLFTPEDRAQGAEEAERTTAQATGRAEDERWHLKKDGSCFWGSGVLTRLSDGGMQARFVKVVRDITTRKQAEDRMQSEYMREHRIARTLQSALLPRFTENAFPGFAVAAFYEPASSEASVGGDFYDIVPLREGRTAFIIGDVAGKGLGAAARTGEVRAALRAFLREDADPASALTRLNALVCDFEQLDGIEEHLLIAAGVVVVDTRTGDTRFAVAGLEAPLLAADVGTVEAIPVRGVMLGATRAAFYENFERCLNAGDLLILVTDGLTEVRREDRSLGEHGLRDVIEKALPGRSPVAIGEAVLSEVRRYASDSPARGALRDDACLLLARRLPPPGPDATV